MAEEISSVLTDVKPTDDENNVEKNKLDTMVSDLAQDYSKYLKVNITAEVKLQIDFFIYLIFAINRL